MAEGKRKHFDDDDGWLEQMDDNTNDELSIAYSVASKHMAAVHSRGDLREHGCDSMDTIEISVADLKAALIEAYRLGRPQVKRPSSVSRDSVKNSERKLPKPHPPSHLDFWTAFNEYAFEDEVFKSEFEKTEEPLFAWVKFGIGVTDCEIWLSRYYRKRIRAELRMRRKAKELYCLLLEKKDVFEEYMGDELIWGKPDSVKSLVIITAETAADRDDKSQWEEQINWFMDVMIKMKRAVEKYYQT